MSKKFASRLANQVTIIIITILWILPLIPILASIIRKGSVDVIGALVLSAFTIVFTPFAIGALFNRIIIMEDSIILKLVFKKKVAAKFTDMKKISITPVIQKYGGFRNYDQRLSRIDFLNFDNKILITILLPGWKVDRKVGKIKEQLKARGCKGLVVAHIENAD